MMVLAFRPLGSFYLSCLLYSLEARCGDRGDRCCVPDGMPGDTRIELPMYMTSTLHLQEDTAKAV